MAGQTVDPALAERFAPLATRLREQEPTINAELLAVQGSPADLGGYYWPNDEKTSAVMRPVAQFNEIIDGLKK